METTSIETKGETSTATGETTAYATKEDVKNVQNFLLAFMAGVVIFVVGTFWIEIFSVHRNYAQDKSIVLQNNQLTKDYFEKVLFLNNKIQSIEMSLEILKAKNTYLK